ncbi:uncharacterized protein BP5553_08118 [Venustampulla echinocandica]|uniref:RRM domain-containing protein n=1 Tax=Venustampulla echinocandica TaxID=2656787 RepID=A0A370TFS6_9HELO|nr:uncharacterized protein BP5553_08118 [Venustampulla echinocandica]RDL33750.1 hypothetical protein BP5553_08118 [Venustampulla echinocandica]
MRRANRDWNVEGIFGNTLVEGIDHKLLLSTATTQHHTQVQQTKSSISTDNLMRFDSQLRDSQETIKNRDSSMFRPDSKDKTIVETFQPQQAHPTWNPIPQSEYVHNTRQVPCFSQTTATIGEQNMNAQGTIIPQEFFSRSISPIKPTRSESRWVTTSAFRQSTQSLTRALNESRSTKVGHGYSTIRQPLMGTAAISPASSIDRMEEGHIVASSVPWRSATDGPQTQYLRPSPSRQPGGPTEDNFGYFRSRSYTLESLLMPPRDLNPTATWLNQTAAIADTKTAFRPSGMWLRKRDPLQENSQLEQMQLGNTGYQGDLCGESYRSQIRNLDDTENCALWVTNIPPSASAADMFDIINCGAVFSLHINKPNLHHRTAAAKLVFIEPHSATEFFTQASRGIQIGDTKLKVIYNRHGSRRSGVKNSRILLVEGPASIMTFEYWDTFFRRYCEFDWDRVLPLHCPHQGRRILEFRFMRIDGQAQMCLKALQRDPAHKYVSAEYGADPCNPESRQNFETNMSISGAYTGR